MGVLGINRRNSIIVRDNDREAIALANDKLAAKDALSQAGVAVPATLLAVADISDLVAADLGGGLPDSFVLKPNRGRQGLGIVVATDGDGESWRAEGKRWSAEDIRQHIRRILMGEFCEPGVHRDKAFIEATVEPHASFAGLGARGLPDVRVICAQGKAAQSMVRLPLESSQGRANLHRGAVGMGLDLETGRCVRAFHDGREVQANPDSGERLIGFTVPYWADVLSAAAKSAERIGLGYAGVDVVIDDDEGVQVLEVNAFPGLEIQNVNGAGLHDDIESSTGESDEELNW